MSSGKHLSAEQRVVLHGGGGKRTKTIIASESAVEAGGSFVFVVALLSFPLQS